MGFHCLHLSTCFLLFPPSSFRPLFPTYFIFDLCGGTLCEVTAQVSFTGDDRVVRKCLTASAADTAALGAYVQRFADAYFRRQPELADSVTAERAALDALNQRWSAHTAAAAASAVPGAPGAASSGAGAAAAAAAFSVESEARLEAVESAARAQREASLGGGSGSGAAAEEQQRSPVARARAASVHSFVSTNLEDGDETAAAAATAAALAEGGLSAERKLAPAADDHAAEATVAMSEDESDFLVCTNKKFLLVLSMSFINAMSAINRIPWLHN